MNNLQARVAHLLERAAQRIERYGWCQGAWREVAGADAWMSPADVLTAIDLAAGYDPVRRIGRRPDAATAARAVLLVYLQRQGVPVEMPSDISIWNDELGRQPIDIVTALRGAAEMAREAATA